VYIKFKHIIISKQKSMSVSSLQQNLTRRQWIWEMWLWSRTKGSLIIRVTFMAKHCRQIGFNCLVDFNRFSIFLLCLLDKDGNYCM